jgi:hypothetical protein
MFYALYRQAGPTKISMHCTGQSNQTFQVFAKTMNDAGLRLPAVNHFLQGSVTPGLPDLSSCNIPKRAKMYRIATKLPIGHRLY